MKTREEVMAILETIPDPEVPVLSIQDLGIIRGINIKSEEEVEVMITPTYSGCPAMHLIGTQIKMELLAQGFREVRVTEILSPPWTTDWMSEAGKQKLKAYGIAPPQYMAGEDPGEEKAKIVCPLCDSAHTQLVSRFGSTACKALYKCLDCLEPFDYFKCH